MVIILSLLTLNYGNLPYPFYRVILWVIFYVPEMFVKSLTKIHILVHLLLLML